MNFPKQAVTDATEIVRPFTLRGLLPDHSLVLINGQRRYTTALLNVFSNGSAPGSSGVDLNAFPSSVIDRIEVLRDGASTQYGSDAIAGVVNLVLKDGAFTPFVNTSVGQYRPGNGFRNDGTTEDIAGGVGFKLGRGSLGLFGQYLNRDATNGACPDGSFPDLNGVRDSVADCQVIIKRNRLSVRSTLTANYASGRFHALVRSSNYGSYIEGSLDGLETFKPRTLLDVEAGYRFAGVNLNIGSRNVFNVYPGKQTVEANTNNGTFSYPGASPFGYNGRFVYARAEILLNR